MSGQSSFTFVVKPGSSFMFELEPFYYNLKTKMLEPMSACSKSTPRSLKEPFGPIKDFAAIDSELFEIQNFKEETITLKYSKLSPRLESEDSMIKRTLIAMYDRGVPALVSGLNSLLDKFHNQNTQTGGETDPRTPSSGRGDPLETSVSSTLEGGSSFQEAECSTSLSRTSTSSSVSLLRRDEQIYREDQLSPCKKAKVASALNIQEVTNKDVDLELDVMDGERSEKQVTNDPDKLSRLSRIELVIEESKYQSISPDICEVPPSVIVNRDLVNELKDSLKSHPDKTQCFLGVVCVIDEEGNQSKKFQVYVNPELFLAIIELQHDGFCFYNENLIPAILHIISEKDSLDEVSLGMFLNQNSKEFSNKIRDSMSYQDLLRFCCHTVNNMKQVPEELKTYLKQALKQFSKGRQNASIFITFASLPKDYLSDFDTFLKLFETGSLQGQNLSSRQLCNVDKRRNRKRSVKLEMPMTLLKSHLKVSQELRVSLLDAILNGSIGYSEYCSRIKKAAEVTEVKKHIETISKCQFSAVLQKQPEGFSDKVLEKFVGAKISTSGQNSAFANLTKHVNVALSKHTNTEEVPAPCVVFSHSDNLNILSLGRKMKTFRLVIQSMGGEKSVDEQFCLKEQIKDDSGTIGLIINISDEKKLRDDLGLTFHDTDVVVEFIQVKKKIPTVEKGFIKETETLAIFGDKSCFEDKAIKTLYSVETPTALHSVISDVLERKETVLYLFPDESQAFDLDPMGTLIRKKIQIEYLSKKSVIETFSGKMNRRMNTE